MGTSYKTVGFAVINKDFDTLTPKERVQVSSVLGHVVQHDNRTIDMGCVAKWSALDLEDVIKQLPAGVVIVKAVAVVSSQEDLYVRKVTVENNKVQTLVYTALENDVKEINKAVTPPPGFLEAKRKAELMRRKQELAEQQKKINAELKQLGA